MGKWSKWLFLRRFCRFDSRAGGDYSSTLGDDRLDHALELVRGSECLFVSDSKWIYPLFELEAFLASQNLRPEELQVRDRVVGRAAALVQVYLQLGSVHAGLLSEGGRRVLAAHGVSVTFGRLVDRIGCQTEEILAEELDPGRAYRLLRHRAGLEQG